MEKFIVRKKRKRKGEDEKVDGEPEKKKQKVCLTDIKTFKKIEDTVPSTCDWSNFLQEQFKMPYFKILKKFLIKEEKAKKTVYPPVNEVFSAFFLCPLDNIKVVILGQDPYHQPNQAHGLSFSVKKGVKHPPSLRNIFKELKTEYSHFKVPKSGDLTGWAEQGVFMLNDVLTVIDSTAHAHKKKGWETFTSNVIDYINKKKKNVVFILWGNHAKKKGKNVDKKRHKVIQSGHPSPLSQRYFFGSKPFSKANEYLSEKGINKIDWCNL